jgi:two-component system nitrate/nitrite response regulator NarL
MVMIHGGSSAASTSNSREPLSQSSATVTGMGPGEIIMVVVRGQLFRDGIRSVLQAPGRTVIGSCETLEQIVSKIETLPPTDLFVVGGYEPEHLPELFAGIRKLRSRVPNAKLLVLSPRTDPRLLREALESEADGLLLEDSPAEVLQLLTRLILLGHAFVPTPLARVLSQEPAPPDQRSAPDSRNAPDLHAKQRQDGKCAAHAEGETNHPAPHRVNAPRHPRSGMVPAQNASNGEPERRRQIDLSDRENEILGCLVSGHSNKIIARKLDIAEATVKVHVKGLLRKMQVSNRTQAAIRALQNPTGPVVPGGPTDGTM